MNSEELELSLRTEFENYLKNTLVEMRQEISQFQEKIEAEIEKHKSQLDGVFQDFSTRIAADKEFDEGFKETVVEHLRLARDEGARITATAFAEAEALAKESAAEQEAEAEPAQPAANIGQLLAAINDISSKTTQSSILKTLVNHAAEYTPRGAFFIIKNEHLVGWRVFGKEGDADEQAVREVFFPVAASTVLGEAVRSLSAVESAYGTYTDDSIYLNKFEFGHPDQMYAIPLVVRGRSVAVLYADSGSDGENVNIEALEALARVASLTVEVLASARNNKAETAVSQPEQREESAFSHSEESFDNQYAPEPEAAESYEPAATAEQSVQTVSEYTAPSINGYDFSTSPQNFQESEPQVEYDFPAEEAQEEEIAAPQAEFEAAEEAASWSEPAEISSEEEVQYFEPVTEETDTYLNSSADEYQFSADEPSAEFEEAPQDFQDGQIESPEIERAGDFSSAQDSFASFETQNGKSEAVVSAPVETVAETATPVRSRFTDRNVDLPIEVSEDERRLHNDARRFARLLVSEIKLYNEQKVKEGREAHDLYERLREAIDRSREMYDKRVQPPVAARFDYFHYEVVTTLAEGDESKLGESYPGATV